MKFLGGPLPGKQTQWCEGYGNLTLWVAVLVIAVSGGHRHAPGLFPDESGQGLFPVWVQHDRRRDIGVQDLQAEGKRRA
ncbi:hypothetical protein GCM10017708_06350 [Arthrobacter citreus]